MYNQHGIQNAKLLEKPDNKIVIVSMKQISIIKKPACYKLVLNLALVLYEFFQDKLFS